MLRVTCLQVYALESNVLCRRLVTAYVAANSLESHVVILDKSASELTDHNIDFNKVGSMSVTCFLFPFVKQTENSYFGSFLVSARLTCRNV